MCIRLKVKGTRLKVKDSQQLSETDDTGFRLLDSGKKLKTFLVLVI
jgi:hypothetical protein